IDQMNSRALDEAPPFLFVAKSLSDFERPGAISMNRKFMGRGVTFRELPPTASGTSRTRVRTGGVELPPGKFDYLVSLASGQQEALQRLLRDKFGFTAQRVTQKEDVFVLTARPGEYENLKPVEGFEEGSRVWNSDTSFEMRNSSISSLARNLEQVASIPVVDETGLRGRFDVILSWDPQVADQPGGRNSKPPLEAVTEALSAQLGFDLRKGRRDLEVLLVKTAKPGR